MNRRYFLNWLAAMGLAPKAACSIGYSPDIYDFSPFGNCSLIHLTDTHAQLLPVYYREPTVQIDFGLSQSGLAHLNNFRPFFGVMSGARAAYAFTASEFFRLAAHYSKMGGYALLAALINRIRSVAGSERTLVLEGGDTWQGSATALWTGGRDMVAVSNRLGVDVMTGHWEFTYGVEQVWRNCEYFAGELLAHNVAWSDEAQFEGLSALAQVFKSYAVKTLGSARIAVIGQAFPYTSIAHSPRFTPHWHFSSAEDSLQSPVNSIKARRETDVIVQLSHNGLPVDVKLAARVTGIDIIRGGHTHEAVPQAIPVDNAKGRTWVAPGSRWGPALLPGQALFYEDIMAMTTITYTHVYTRMLTGRQLKNLLEDVADNLFNPYPYYRQGGDMVRVGGMRFKCRPQAGFGKRIEAPYLAGGQTIVADKRYKITGWAGVEDDTGGMPVANLMAAYLKQHGTG